MSADVIDLCKKEKEHSILKGKIDCENLKKNEIQEGEIQLSPPRKKLKQDAISFPKVSKEEAGKISIDEKDKKANPEQQENGHNKQENGHKQTDESLLSSSKENSIVLDEKRPLESPTSQIQNKSKIIKSSPAEKQRLEKEKWKQDRLKEIEERKKQKEEERKKREEERLQKLAEKEKREFEKKIEREKKELERKEKEKQKEEERKKREEEKRKKDEQKESERKAKEAEREKKEAERKEKEDTRRQEEEKRKQKEEFEKRKKAKAANQFKSFFTKKTQAEKKTEEKVEDCHRFVPFQVKANMTLAPCVRKTDFNKTMVDRVIGKELPDLSTYLEELSVKIANCRKTCLVTRRQLRRENELKRKPESEAHRKTTSNNEKKAMLDNSITMSHGVTPTPKALSSEKIDVIVIEVDSNDKESDEEYDDDDDDEETSFAEDTQKLMRAKFLKFSENTRPPYYGTWRKKTKTISGRKPFGQDNDIFNYDVDSDEEWIDEPGEDCSDNGDDDEEDEKETEDDQDGFFVPHGYLSDDEGVNDTSDIEENDDVGENDEKNKRTLSKDATDGKREQEKLKSKVDSFEVVFKKTVKPRKPITIGIVYTNNIEELHPLLREYRKVPLFKSIVDKDKDETIGDVENNAGNDDVSKIPSSAKNAVLGDPDSEIGPSTPQTVPEEGMSYLIRLVHGNCAGLAKMCQEFRKFWTSYTKVNSMNVRTLVSKRQLEKKIQAISTRGMNSELGKVCYTISDDVLSAYELTGLKLASGLPNIEEYCSDEVIAETNNKLPDSICNESTTVPVSKNNGTCSLVANGEKTWSKNTEYMVID